MRLAEAPRELGLLASCPLGFDEQSEAIVEGERSVFGRRTLSGERLSHAFELQFAQTIHGRLSQHSSSLPAK